MSVKKQVVSGKINKRTIYFKVSETLAPKPHVVTVPLQRFGGLEEEVMDTDCHEVCCYC